MSWLKRTLSKLVNSNFGRSVSHAGVAFGATIAGELTLTSLSAAKASLIAALPAAAAAVFRALFPNVPVD